MAGKTYSLSPSGRGRTVFDDGATDVLIGSLNPSVVDWFFYNDANDQLVHLRRKTDTLTIVR